jgi:hypothetical protein
MHMAEKKKGEGGRIASGWRREGGGVKKESSSGAGGVEAASTRSTSAAADEIWVVQASERGASSDVATAPIASSIPIGVVRLSLERCVKNRSRTRYSPWELSADEFGVLSE